MPRTGHNTATSLNQFLSLLLPSLNCTVILRRATMLKAANSMNLYRQECDWQKLLNSVQG
eukprot:scaffold3827_cov179-Cylindrotheca_fusiformis.AAC.35